MTFFEWLIDLLGARLAQAAEAGRLRRLVAQGVVSWGEGAYGVPRVLTFQGSPARLVVGPYVSITTGATFVLGGNHPTAWVSLYPFRARMGLPGAYEDGMPYAKGDISVGADAWIGHEALVMSGVSIGVGAIVAARSVVTRSVPAYAVVAGNPAAVVKYRFDESTRMRLADSYWWERPADELRNLVPMLSSADTEGFLAALSMLRRAE